MESLAQYGLVPVAEEPALAGAARALPLRARDGSVRAYAIVDADLYPELSRSRWCLRPKGYVGRNIRRADGTPTTEKLHRVVLGLKNGDPRQGDHINRDPLDNRRVNLRIAGHGQNAQNVSSAGNRGSSSRYRGVTRRKNGKWMAQGQVEREAFYLGVFDTEQEAADVAAAWRELHMPFTTN